MAQKYLLPCECGHQLPVEGRQAGETITCQCGRNLDIPPLRHLRKLKPAPEEAVPRRRKTWSLVHGLVFATGMVVCAGGLLFAAYYQWGRANLRTEETAWDNLEEGLTMLDNMSAAEAWDAWVEIKKRGLGVQMPPEFVIHRWADKAWIHNIYWGLGVAAGGLGLIGLALVLPGPPPKKRAATKRSGQPRR